MKGILKEMPIKNEILQNLETKSEENVEQKPTKWKEFKTEHPKAAKILKVGAIGTGVSLAAGAVLTPVGVGVAAVAGALSFKLAVAGMSTAAAARRLSEQLLEQERERL
ncbi:hypothetical protein [Spiroplasma endosymbiont of Amphimallon solstitiale]|uniref:hypothetical protein n=1 Tax=Spiroplasma endosymbiont of Amphimallon solstitiale TaxID=3066288 RepID=UPI00313D7507